VLTDWIFVQASRVAPSPFSNETQELIKKYVPSRPEEDRQFRELALVVGYSLLLPPAVGLWGLIGWLVSGGYRPSEEFVRIGWGLIVVLLAGLGLHLIRYYDARFKARRGGGTRSDPRWPRASTDLDFVVQIAVGVAAAILGAPA
jgi:hypothetical protein